MKISLKKLLVDLELAEKLKPEEIVDVFSSLEERKSLSVEDALKLIDLFCATCWQLENIFQQEKCFSLLHVALAKLPREARGDLVKRLMDKSIFYPRFVYLVREFLCSMTVEERKALAILTPKWLIMDESVIISQNEYEWRKKRGLVCSQDMENVCYRLTTWSDLEYQIAAIRIFAMIN